MKPEDDALVRAFEAGLAAWEHPLEGEGRPPAPPGGAVRTRGAVRARGGDAQLDADVEQFQAGVRAWEYPLGERPRQP
jgi:hypothetical protein